MEKRIVDESLTFDDVLLLPGYSEVLPHQVDVSTWLTPSLRLRCPIISAAMDTVTESAMAIAVAREGGIGIIHKNMPIEKQANEVLKVKKYEAGVVSSPTSVTPDMLISEIIALAKELGYTSFPVVHDTAVCGMLTNRDIKYVSEPEKCRVRDVMTPLERIVKVIRSSSKDSDRIPGEAHEESEKPSDDRLLSPTIKWTRAEIKHLMRQHHVEKVLVVDEEMRLEGIITHRDIIKSEEEPGACRDISGRLVVGGAIGCSSDAKARAQALVANGVDLLVVDSSHGHSYNVLETIRTLKELFPSTPMVGGNVCTAEGANALADAGADVVKVGVGPGSICTTRIVTGCGRPQLSAICEVAAAMKPRNVSVIADGGIRYSGDITKALAVGAQCVMLGSVLAGTDEAPGRVELMNGRAFKSYCGMGSLSAMERGSADRYFQTAARKLVPEGVEARVPYKGSVHTTIHMQLGGLRSAMGLTGCSTIKELAERAKFVRVSARGVAENHPHSVEITREPPNYSGRI